MPKVPLVFAANVWGHNSVNIGVTGDYWIMNPKIVGPLYWYFGPGLAAAVGIHSDGCNLFAGGRFVVGLDVFPIKPLEIYLQAAAELGLDIYFGNDNGFYFGWGVPISLGVRWWF